MPQTCRQGELPEVFMRTCLRHSLEECSMALLLGNISTIVLLVAQ